ncbi:2,4-dienoyl-CoA reductase-like NADH-dependent reductase (Old Yellow Enzyme family) [Paraburkholderia sp. BL6669N2]|uniref:NADH:flavin oxidoreductase n=1 Tax=Paraburkholderia sp. BL6669N2 TaxID=1938807 RepID=UPI000E26495F|nr:NADH:flavin oxidoreductase [Paraburkholderia sp. BL6669N2]REG58429.1 2,4-dienoyl-CoA reductase-like NADH-dependent reductase (Old Yellow Enzyme family) [Paraburkholderia sp. BL6669N2]
MITAPLFAPLSVRGITLANRVVMSPMTRGFSPDGLPGPDVASYYQRRAEGETGLIITEGVGIDHPSALGEAGLGENSIPTLTGPESVEAWRLVTDAVHASGGVIFPQLWHMGPMKEAHTGPVPSAAPMRPSGLWGPRGGLTSLDAGYLDRVQPATRPMTDEEIADVIAAYRRSASHAKTAGFDGIALHGGHGYLIDSFLWSETNKRADAWGKDLVARSRFAAEVVREIRAELGETMPISFRFSQWKQQDFKARLASTPEELEQILTPLAEAGVDIFEASTRYFNRPEFEGSDMNLAGWAKKVTGKLSMTVGGIGINKGYYDSMAGAQTVAQPDLRPLLDRFMRNEFDLVGVGRSLLHDANWARRARLGEPFLGFSTDSLVRLT